MVPRCGVGENEVLIALTRERGRNEGLRLLIGDRADVVEVPLTATYFRPETEVEAELRSLHTSGEFRSLVVTSARCAPYVMLTKEVRAATCEIFSVGPATTEALERLGLDVTRESLDTALDLAPFITEGPVLLLAATAGRVELREALSDRCLDPQLVECYSTRDATLTEGEKEQLRHAHAVFIGAPSAWRAARAFVDDLAWVLVPGTTTFDVVKGDHQRVLVGWGDNFASAWREIVMNSP